MKTNIILKRLFVLGLGVMLSAGAMAQSQQGTPKKQLTPAQRQEKMEENYKKNLNLTEPQTRQLHAINQRMVEGMQAIRNDRNLTRDQKKERMKALQETRHQEIDAILNAEQKQKFAEMQQKQETRKQNMKQKHGKHGQQHGGRKMQQKPQSK